MVPGPMESMSELAALKRSNFLGATTMSGLRKSRWTCGHVLIEGEGVRAVGTASAPGTMHNDAAYINISDVPRMQQQRGTRPNQHRTSHRTVFWVLAGKLVTVYSTHTHPRHSRQKGPEQPAPAGTAPHAHGGQGCRQAAVLPLEFATRDLIPLVLPIRRCATSSSFAERCSETRDH